MVVGPGRGDRGPGGARSLSRSGLYLNLGQMSLLLGCQKGRGGEHTSGTLPLPRGSIFGQNLP